MDKEKNEEKIKAQAKGIMDEFMAALEKVSEAEIPYGLEREENTRKAEKSKNDPGFRERMFNNAPKVKDDCIVAEKKTW